MSTLNVDNLKTLSGNGIDAQIVSIGGGQLSHRNKVINGGMLINQRASSYTSTGGEYTLDGKDYVGDYHIHYTGVAMTGSDHTEDSEVLELRNKKQRIKTISGVVASISASSTSTGGY